MKSLSGNLAAPFPYFGGKSLACKQVWAALGNPKNYVEPFAGSAAMLLGRPDVGVIETINDADGFVANFWRAVSFDADAVAKYVDWPVNETDLFSRHSWLVNNSHGLLDRLHADPEFYDAKIAGWWCWGACCWIGTGWCSGKGPWVNNGYGIVDSRKLQDFENSGTGINRKLPHLGNIGRGVNRKLIGGADNRTEYIQTWFKALQNRMRDVRVAAGDWRRVVTRSVTYTRGLTGVFIDPPYTKGNMDYSVGGVGGKLADDVRSWCLENGENKLFRIVLCGLTGEHDELLNHGWSIRTWTKQSGYGVSKEAIKNSKSETLWCSPNCLQESATHGVLL